LCVSDVAIGLSKTAIASWFHNGDKPTYRHVMVVGRLFCLAFVVISFSLRAESSSW